MIKYNKKCKVCSEIKRQPKLAELILKSKAYDRTSELSLKALHNDYQTKFSYDGLKNHVKKHQGITSEDLSQRHLKNIVKKAEAEVLKKKLESKDIWDSVLDKGGEALENGTMKIRAGDLLRAAKDKSDYDLKVKDQELAMIEMVYHFASGESRTKITGKRLDAEPTGADAQEKAGEPLHLTPGTPADTGAGEDRPGGVHYPPTWDAATFRPGTLPTGNDF